MADELSAYFPPEEIEAAKGLVTLFYGKPLISHKLNRRDALILAIYMLSNQRKAPVVPRDDVEKFYTEAARSKVNKKYTTEFSKALYEVTKDKKRKTLVRQEDRNLGLNSLGLSRMKELLKGETREG